MRDDISLEESRILADVLLDSVREGSIAFVLDERYTDRDTQQGLEQIYNGLLNIVRTGELKYHLTEEEISK